MNRFYHGGTMHVRKLGPSPQIGRAAVPERSAVSDAVTESGRNSKVGDPKIGAPEARNGGNYVEKDDFERGGEGDITSRFLQYLRDWEDRFAKVEGGSTGEAAVPGFD